MTFVHGGVAAETDDPARRRTWRIVFSVALTLALGVAIWAQRETISGAVSEIGGLGPVAIVALGALTIYERWSRADIVRRLLGGPVDLGTSVVIHDVGTAVSKGVPLGGALGTALRWTIARDAGIRPPRFATMLIAYGIATTFVAWFLPFAAMLADLTQRSADVTDVIILLVIAAVIAGSAVFWLLVLRSERVECWAESNLRRLWTRLARRVPSVEVHDPAAGVSEVRRSLHMIARRPWSLLGATILAQLCGAIILLVSLRSLGVGAELGTTEFFRVFFITHLLGTFAPTPGGVGVVEAGMTGALMAAGVDTTTALAGVLVYRFLTYALPIVFGALLYVAWRARRVRGNRRDSAKLGDHGPPIEARVPDVSRTAHQGIRHG